MPSLTQSQGDYLEILEFVKKKKKDYFPLTPHLQFLQNQNIFAPFNLKLRAIQEVPFLEQGHSCHTCHGGVLVILSSA